MRMIATDHRGGDAASGSADDGSDVGRIVRAAQAGDRDAFGELYRRYASFVHGVALSRVDASDADDVVHDAFAQAMAKLHTLQNPLAFGSWIAAIARNCAGMTRRRAFRLVALPAEVPDRRDAQGDLDGERVLDAIRSLPDAYREPLMLRLVEGLSGVEIAARMGMTHGSVRVNLWRGMALLRKSLGGRDAG
jgi:RNA polymerase sigma-70 factor (ECF subfamily)